MVSEVVWNAGGPTCETKSVRLGIQHISTAETNLTDYAKESLIPNDFNTAFLLDNENTHCAINSITTQNSGCFLE